MSFYNIMKSMGRKKKKKSVKDINIKSSETKTTFGLVLFILSIALITTPFFDEVIFTYLSFHLGFSSILWGIALLYLSGRFITKASFFQSTRRLIALLLLAFNSAILLSFIIPQHRMISTVIPPDLSRYGGQLGYSIHMSLYGFMGPLLEFIIIAIVYLISFSMLFDINTSDAAQFIENLLKTKKTSDITVRKSEDSEPVDENRKNETEPRERKFKIFSSNKPKEDNETEALEQLDKEYFDDYKEPPAITTKVDKKENKINSRAEKDEEDGEFPDIYEPRYSDWSFPDIKLLKDVVKRPQDEQILKKKAQIIEETLESFGIQSRVIEIVIGPTVVQFALKINIGTKVAKIKNLSNDLALALATSANSIRLEAPIPGTSLIGIEIPNPTPNFVFIKEMVANLQAKKESFELPIILGKSVSGDVVIKDLTSLPHLLVAGATGTGKSVGINAMIIGMLMTKTPDELKLILVDPKMVEMSPYNGIPHLLTPVVTEMELVVNALQWAVEEMHKRYRMLKSAGVRKITEYNEKLGFIGMPYIVIIIDEMADLMLSTGVDVESKIVRLAQMSRAVGIHLILATQRPSVDVITGLIKANIPGRVSFAVTTAIDSRVIIDQSGSENLIGKGDMLFKSPELPKPIRIQGAYTDIKDIENIIGSIKEQADGEVEYFNEVLENKDDSAGTTGMDGEERDELFADALEAVINIDKASASYLQRKFRIGYNRAARILDELQEAGAVGPQDGSNPRKVLVSSPDQILGDDSEEIDNFNEEDL